MALRVYIYFFPKKFFKSWKDKGGTTISNKFSQGPKINGGNIPKSAKNDICLWSMEQAKTPARIKLQRDPNMQG